VGTYHVAPLFLIPLIWAPYLLRRTLGLLPSHFALFVIAVLLHDLGAYGYYQHSPLPFSFDIAVHFYFAFAVAFAMHRVLQIHLPLRLWQIDAATLICMMAFGALHEVMEFVSSLLLGDQGMLKKDSYVFDTNRDLTNNLLGVLLALVIIVINRSRRPRFAAGGGFPVEVPDQSFSSAGAPKQDG
jgi:uncharacterized membrane protein YjdF